MLVHFIKMEVFYKQMTIIDCKTITQLASTLSGTNTWTGNNTFYTINNKSIC